MSVTSTATLDVVVTIGPAWKCRSEGRCLADVVLAVDVTTPNDGDGEEEQKLKQLWGDGVLLERGDDGNADPCILTVSCVHAAVGRLVLVSEARTMEVYLRSGEYCGTVRGEKQEHIQQGERGPFYKKQLSLDAATSSCDIKLLSLSNGSSVMLRSLLVGLRQAPPGRPEDNTGTINLQRVQSLVDEMGTGLSPGARNLMDMVRQQQKNQSGLLPLLMGGGFLSALARPPNVGGTPDAQPEADSVGPAHPTVEILCDFLKGRREGVGPAPPEMLRELCGQVTKLRLDQDKTPPIFASMERRLEEMERRLKDHMDRRLDALEVKLERALLAILPQGASADIPSREVASGHPATEAMKDNQVVHKFQEVSVDCVDV
ncbi:ATPase PAAT [Stigmatopora nigra]